MPVFKIKGFGDEVLEAKGGDFQPYDGPVPPKGTILVGVIKQFQLVRNRNDELMLKCLFEAKGNEDDKAQYNGLPVWWNGNITEQGKGFVNDFLVHLALFNGVDPQKMKFDFWKKGPAVESDKLPSPIKAIGTFAVNADGMKSKISTKVGSYKGEEKPEVGFWIIPKRQAPIDGADNADEPVEIIGEDAGDGTEVEVIEDDEIIHDDEGSSGGPRDDQKFSDEPPF